MSARGAVRLEAAGLLLFASACPKPHPAVHEQRFAMSADALQRIAVMPFYPQPGAQQGGAALIDPEIGELVASTFAEALQRSGVSVIPPNDLVMAIASKGLPTLRLDPLRAAQIERQAYGDQGKDQPHEQAAGQNLKNDIEIHNRLAPDKQRGLGLFQTKSSPSGLLIIETNPRPYFRLSQGTKGQTIYLAAI